MFILLAQALGNADTVLTGHRPSQLSEYLEETWFRRQANEIFGEPPTPAPSPLEKARPTGQWIDTSPLVPPLGTAVWPHLIYAYMMENTRIVPIFRKLLKEWLSGGRLPQPSAETQRWIRATEALFFSTQWPFSVYSTTSSLRSDSEAMRRNAYFRLFGLNLNHGTDEGGQYKYELPASANTRFAPVLESLLTEVWQAFTYNRRPAVGQDRTDDVAMADKLRSLAGMLQAQRPHGTLSREEFAAVALLSWLQLTINSNNAVVNNLNAQAPTAAERLAKIGEMVGIPAHSRSDAYVQIARPLAAVVRAIENNAIVGVLGAQSLYLAAGFFQQVMQVIVNHWCTISGRDIKNQNVSQVLPPRLATRAGQIVQLA